MPLLVTPIWPSRNALLLFGSSQDSVPGNEGLVELLAVLERRDRLRAVDHDVVLRVDHLAAVRPDEPVAPGVARRRSRCRARTRPACPSPLAPWQSLRKPASVLREGVEARRLHGAIAIDQACARQPPIGNGDPTCPSCVQYALQTSYQPPYFAAEVVGTGRSRRPACPDTGARPRRCR